VPPGAGGGGVVPPGVGGGGVVPPGAGGGGGVMVEGAAPGMGGGGGVTPVAGGGFTGGIVVAGPIGIAFALVVDRTELSRSEDSMTTGVYDP
jgi:hypothetical protein